MYHINDTQNILVFFLLIHSNFGSRRDTKIKRKKNCTLNWIFGWSCHFSLILACTRHWESSPVFDTRCCIVHVYTPLRIEMWTVNGDNYPPIKISYKGIDLFLKGYVTITVNDKCFVTQLEYISILIGIYIYLNWYIYNQL